MFKLTTRRKNWFIHDTIIVTNLNDDFCSANLKNIYISIHSLTLEKVELVIHLYIIKHQTT